MGLGTLTRGRSCATSHRSKRTWQVGNESVCDTWVVLSFRASQFSSVWSVVATFVLSSDRVCRNKNRKPIYDASVPKQDAAHWWVCAANCVLQLAANWQRRVMEVVESFPCRLAKDRPGVDSSRKEDRCRRDGRWELRRELCCWEAQGSLRAREREHARCTGELSPVLFQLICDMGRVWNTDVQEIEGCNNTIQHISKLAPSMSWMLLSARVMTKKLIALLPTRAAKSEFLAECVLRHTKAATIVCSEKD